MPTSVKHPTLPFVVFSDGSVRGPSGKMLKPRPTSCGYLRVVCYLGGKFKSHSVHRLVAECFIPGVGAQVNHIDGDKTNNCVTNLEWCSASANIRHAIATGLLTYDSQMGHKRTVGALNGRAKLTVAQVRDIRDKYSAGYPRGAQPWAKYGISSVMFRNVIRRTNWKDVA